MNAADPTARSAPVTDDGYKWKAFAAVGSFFVTSVLGLTMVFVALPAMAEEFGVTLKAAAWIIIAPSLTISALLLPFGRLADLVGRRRVHLFGLALYAVGAAMTATAPSFTVLIVARVVMSVGGALTESVGTGILVSVFPSSERGKAIGSQTSAVAVGGAMGPLVAGVAITFLSWRALFWLLVIMTAVCFVIGVLVLDEKRITPTNRERSPFDWAGAALSVVLIVSFVIVINNPFELAFRSLPMLGSAALVVVGMWTFVLTERRSPHPMLNLRFFESSIFSRAVVARTLGFVASSAVVILVPILLVSVIGIGEGRAAIAVFLNSVGLGVGAQISGRLSDRWGSRIFMLFGFFGMAATMVLFSLMGQTTALWWVSVVSLLSGLATGNWNVPNNATVISTVPRTDYGVVGAFTNLARNVGNVLGQAMIAAVVTGVLAARGFDIPLGEIGDTVGAGAAFVDGWRIAFWVTAGLAVVAGGLVSTIRR